MRKRKVQTIIYFCAADKIKYFLLLKMNERRNFLWQNVTGGVDDGESFKEAALREAIEETGLVSENIESLNETELQFQFTDQWQNNVEEKVFLLNCKSKFNVQIDPSEHSEFKWVSEKEIHPQIVHYPSNYQALVLATEKF